ncbi:hypothetical protein NLG97_g9930 [Lecanicillium saksenae]|uniref:Uncharacterized protein n=1 Tax=Lecanicillium saksenae TaxID=468837 RepID=A0ACC1QF52_9HYPO|nr:hypothetical protein NLG97_g9930 [Lecanicillium saksenae]
MRDMFTRPVTHCLAKRRLEIQLDLDKIVFTGTNEESAGQFLNGTVVLCLSSPTRIAGVSLDLTGILRRRQLWISQRRLLYPILSVYALLLSFSFGAGRVPGLNIDSTASILDDQCTLFAAPAGMKLATLPAGIHEFPFSFALKGDTAETLVGIHEASITYQLKATATRGPLSHELQCQKQFQIIRVPSLAALHISDPGIVAGVWPGKLRYSIGVMQRTVTLGASIDLDISLFPLVEGLEIGTLTAKLIETRDHGMNGWTSRTGRKRCTERQVSAWTVERNETGNWRPSTDDAALKGWMLTKKCNLPKSPHQCTQDMSQYGIEIRHKVVVTVALVNADAHISQLCVGLPIAIHLSPYTAFNSQGDAADQVSADQSVRASQDQAIDLAPPSYNEHFSDRLYCDGGGEDRDWTAAYVPRNHLDSN